MHQTHVVFPTDTLRMAERQLWRLVLSLIVLGLVLFLILNSLNVVPHRNYAWTEHPIDISNSISGTTVQIAPGYGLQSTATGLALDSIEPRFILATTSASNTIPAPLELPLHSILTGETDGLVALQPTHIDQCLQFDGTQVLWKIRNVELEHLADGKTLIGSLQSIPIEEALSGNLLMDRFGVTSIVPGSISNLNFEDNSILLSKIIPSVSTTILTTNNDGTAVDWNLPSINVSCNNTIQTGPTILGAPETIGSHQYDLAGELIFDGQEIIITASGSTTALSGTTEIGVSVFNTMATVSTIETGITGLVYEWNLVCNIQRLTSTTGKMFMVLTKNTVGVSSIVSIANDLIVADWTTTITPAVICGASLTLNAVTCLRSSIVVTTPSLT